MALPSDGGPDGFLVAGPPPLYKGLLSFVTTLYRPDFKAMWVTQYSPEACPLVTEQEGEEDHRSHYPACFPLIPFPKGFSIRPIYICTGQSRGHRRDKFQRAQWTHAFDVSRLYQQEETSTPGQREAVSPPIANCL